MFSKMSFKLDMYTTVYLQGNYLHMYNWNLWYIYIHIYKVCICTLQYIYKATVYIMYN